MTQTNRDLATRSSARSTGPLRRFLPVVAIVLLALLVYAMGWHRELSLENLVRHRAIIDQFVADHRLAAITVFIAIYIAVVALSIPGAVLLSISGGFLFGVSVGALATVVGATTGAICIFLIAKSAFGEYLVRRAGSLAAKLAEGFRADAFSYLLFLRLVPVFPFFLVNLVPALTGVKLRTFVAATVLGILPATFAFAFFGAGLDSVIAAQESAYRACLAAVQQNCRLDFDLRRAITPELLMAFAALGIAALVPVMVKHLRGRAGAWRKN
jgi:uncharacterized membrane protein YdjX (TVP38/TMEM64 family)